MQAAMKYELLLRQVYQCEKNYANGADAAIYRNMERAHHDLVTKSHYGTEDERVQDFRKTFALVRSFVNRAIKDGLSQIVHSASAPVIKELETEQVPLVASFYGKEKLDEIIDKVSVLFHKNGLVI
jgi:hypothetical protein